MTKIVHKVEVCCRFQLCVVFMFELTERLCLYMITEGCRTDFLQKFQECTTNFEDFVEVQFGK